MEISRAAVAPLQFTPASRPVGAPSAKPTSPAVRAQGDKVHFSTQRGAIPAARITFADVPAPASQVASAAQSPAQFGTAVRVDSDHRTEYKRLLGVLNLTPHQERLIQAAEDKAFSRFMSGSYAPERGSLQAKIAQGMTETYNPGYLAHGPEMNVTEEEKKQIMKSLQQYGEELAAIGIMGRNRKELERYLEDKLFITVFDRDKDAFEDYFRDGFKDFVNDSFGSNSPDNDLVQNQATNHASKEGLVAVKDQPQDDYKVRYFRPRVSLRARGTDFENWSVKPGVDLVRLNGPAETEVRVVASTGVKFSGEVHGAEAEIYARRIVNHKPGEYGDLKDNVFIEGRTKYAIHDQQLQTTVGVRKQISPDSSAGVYALYSKTFAGDRPEDLGLGVNYQKRFD